MHKVPRRKHLEWIELSPHPYHEFRHKARTTSIPLTLKVADLQRDVQEPNKGQGLTTNYGVKISDTDNWWALFYFCNLRGPFFKSHFCLGRLKTQDGQSTGPSLLEDPISREKIHRFDHERIPERVVHARGGRCSWLFQSLRQQRFEIHICACFDGSVEDDPCFYPVQYRPRITRQRCKNYLLVDIFSQITYRTYTPLTGYRARCSWLCCQVLHGRRQLGHCRKRHPCLLHSRRYQVPRHHTCRETGAS
jgi:hypothetical protein